LIFFSAIVASVASIALAITLRRRAVRMAIPNLA
jgi:hypothetical protein